MKRFIQATGFCSSSNSTEIWSSTTLFQQSCLPLVEFCSLWPLGQTRVQFELGREALISKMFKRVDYVAQLFRNR